MTRRAGVFVSRYEELFNSKPDMQKWAILPFGQPCVFLNYDQKALSGGLTEQNRLLQDKGLRGIYLYPATNVVGAIWVLNVITGKAVISDTFQMEETVPSWWRTFSRSILRPIVHDDGDLEGAEEDRVEVIPSDPKFVNDQIFSNDTNQAVYNAPGTLEVYSSLDDDSEEADLSHELEEHTTEAEPILPHISTMRPILGSDDDQQWHISNRANMRPKVRRVPDLKTGGYKVMTINDDQALCDLDDEDLDALCSKAFEVTKSTMQEKRRRLLEKLTKHELQPCSSSRLATEMKSAPTLPLDSDSVSNTELVKESSQPTLSTTYHSLPPGGYVSKCCRPFASMRSDRRSLRTNITQIHSYDESDHLRSSDIIRRNRNAGIAVAPSKFGYGSDAGEGLYVTRDFPASRIHGIPDDSTLICKWKGTYVHSWSEAREASRHNHSVIWCTKNTWLIPDDEDWPTKANDAFDYYNSASVWNGTELEFHTMGKLLTGEELSLQYGLRNYWLRNLHKAALWKLVDTYGEKLTRTPHYKIYAKEGLEAYLEYLDSESSYVNDGVTGPPNDTDDDESDSESENSANDSEDPDPGSSEEGDISSGDEEGVRSNSNQDPDTTKKAIDIADQMAQEDEDERERTLLRYGEIISKIKAERNRANNTKLLAKSKKLKVLAVRLKEVKKAVKKLRGYDNPSYQQAKKREDWPQWEAAINLELAQMMEEGVYRKERIEDGANIIGTMWVLVIKRHPDGTIDKYKARLVALGNQQNESSYSNISSTTARSATVKLMMSILAKTERGCSVVLDIKGAYLKSHVRKEDNERLYLKLLDGPIVKLYKYLYGLKQAGYEWQQNVTNCLLKLGYSQSEADPSAFCRWDIKRFIMMCIHVDDFFVVANEQKLIDQLYRELEIEYQSLSKKDGDLLAYLGMQIDVHENEVILSQPGYTQKLLNKHLEGYEANGYKGAIFLTPMNDAPPEKEAEYPPVDQLNYLAIVGGLNYLAQYTRPDILYATSRVAQQCARPTTYDLGLCMRILRYLACTMDFGLWFKKGKIELYCHADASHNCYEDAKGHGGHSFALGPADGSFYATSKKLKLVTLSSTETEYVQLCEAARDAIWLRRLLGDLGFPQVSPTVIWQDNLSTIDFVGGRMKWKATKHVNPKYQFTCEQVKLGHLIIKYKSTTDMIADVLTKALPSRLHCPLTVGLLNNHGLLRKARLNLIK